MFPLHIPNIAVENTPLVSMHFNSASNDRHVYTIFDTSFKSQLRGWLDGAIWIGPSFRGPFGRPSDL
jgi:hypothetical protein